MAKTKTKKEEVIDLKPKAEKITEDQLKRVQENVNGINRLQLVLITVIGAYFGGRSLEKVKK